jgi:hypothetical protein
MRLEPGETHLCLGISANNIDAFVRFEDFTAVAMKNAVFWDVPSCRLCVSERERERACTSHHVYACRSGLGNSTPLRKGANILRVCWVSAE